VPEVSAALHDGLEGSTALAVHRYGLVIVSAGSGNTLPTQEFAGWRIAVMEAGRFGGTCLSRGAFRRRC